MFLSRTSIDSQSFLFNQGFNLLVSRKIYPRLYKLIANDHLISEETRALGAIT